MNNGTANIRLNEERINLFMAMVSPQIGSITQLCDMADIAPNTLRRAIAGDNYTRGTLVAIATVLQCHPHDLEIVEGFPDPLQSPPAISQVR